MIYLRCVLRHGLRSHRLSRKIGTKTANNTSSLGNTWVNRRFTVFDISSTNITIRNSTSRRITTNIEMLKILCKPLKTVCG